MYTDINAYNHHGLTALHITEIHGHTGMGTMLVEAGAKYLRRELCMVINCNNECRVPHNCKEVHESTKD